MAMREKTAKDSHYARLRRQHRERQAYQESATSKDKEIVRLYGLHTVGAALANPRRKFLRLLVTKNAYMRLGMEELSETRTALKIEFCQPRQLDQLLGDGAVHQGVMLEALPLKPRSLSELGNCQLVVLLDQVSDPHNVGALMRSAVAFDAGALITTTRHSAGESGVLAKAASGALEMLDYITVPNLAQALQQLHRLGFITVGLDSAAPTALEQIPAHDRIALVLGSEGRGLRQKTSATVTHLARLDMPGAIHSLNVSNAAALALYVVNKHLNRT